MNKNTEVVSVLNRIADMLEINMDNPYRIRAYRRAARSVEKLDKPLLQLLQTDFDLTSLPYVGKNIAEHIKVILETGDIPENLIRKDKAKRFRNELKQIAGLGPKRLRLLKEKLHIETIEDLKKAIDLGQLTKVPGFNQQLEKKILQGISHPKPYKKVVAIKQTTLMMEALKKRIEKIPGVEQVSESGDYRRKTELVSEGLFIVTTQTPANVIDEFINLGEVKELLQVETDKAVVILHSGFKVTMQIVPQTQFGTTLFYSTGSMEHINALEDIAKRNKIAIHPQADYHDEALIYQQLGLHYTAPELRENRGEIIASQQGKLPKLITLADLKGDLHAHTTETDGTESLEVMVETAIEKGYEYLAITDHTKNLAFVRGLDEKRLLHQIKMIDKLNAHLSNFRILKGSEVDILEDGSLDISDDVLKELDLTVCSVHTRFKLPEDKQTERIIRAMDNPYFKILGHATGRLLLHRNPYSINIEKILTAARERGCFIELNAQPARLDMKAEYCHLAKNLGVKIAISTDTHSIREFNNMRFGIEQARRAWLEPKDVINTRSLPHLLKLLKR